MQVISGTAKGKRLTVPRKEVRPTTGMVREALFNILGINIFGSRFADFFAGSGSVGIEALSRGADFCVFVEKNSQCVKIIKDNLNKTGLSGKAGILRADIMAALRYLAGENKVFDYIFLDPPYGSSLPLVIMDKIRENGLLHPRGALILEHYKKSQVTPGEGWALSGQKSYGDTILSFFSKI